MVPLWRMPRVSDKLCLHYPWKEGLPWGSSYSIKKRGMPLSSKKGQIVRAVDHTMELTKELSNPKTPARDVTRLLMAWCDGDRAALDTLMTIVHDELCVIARSRLRKERRHHTFRTDVLVNEAYLRLCAQKGIDFQSRTHFFGIAARIMRQILVDYAREYQAEKRGGAVERIYVEDIDGFTKERALDLVQLDQALGALDKFDSRKCRIVEMRYFGGLTIEETAQVLDVSPATLKREWAIAKAWLFRNIYGCDRLGK